MPRQVTYEGRSYTFPDDATDQEIADALESAPRRAQQRPQPSRAGLVEDAGRSFMAGLPRGVAFLAGMRGDFAEAQDNLSNEIVRRLGGGENIQRAVRLTNQIGRQGAMGPSLEDIGDRRPNTSSRIIEDTEEAMPFVGYEPQTVAGEYARTFGEFAPAAVFPGSAATRLTRVATPALLSETGGQIGREISPEAEMAGRVIGGLGGSVIAEGAIMANQARNARRLTPTDDAAALETEFAPLTRGERSGNSRQRLDEADYRMGVGSDRAQTIMRNFDANRARQVRDSATRIVTRGQEPLSQDAGEAGVILADELRTARQALRDRASLQYNRAFELARNEPIPQGLNETPSVRVQAIADEYLFEVPAPARQALNVLERQIQEGSATQANVERVRQAMNRELGAAVNARNDATEFVYARIIEALDDWQGSVMSAPRARRAMQEARGIYAEASQLFGRQGRVDLSTGQTGRIDAGGRAIDRTINTDLTGEQILDSILGSGRRPSQQALGAVQRIKKLGTRTVATSGRRADDGVRAPGRLSRGGRTRGGRAFAADDPNAPGGAEMPAPALQALREGFMHRLLGPIDEYVARVQAGGVNEGGLLPAQKMVSQLDNALNRSGREIMRVIYTERELAAMQRLLRYFQRIVPPSGAAYSGTPQGVYRMIARAFDNLWSFFPGLGPVMREVVSEATSTGAARRAVRQTPARPPRRAAAPSAPERPEIAAPALGATIAAQSGDEAPRRLGSPYP